MAWKEAGNIAFGIAAPDGSIERAAIAASGRKMETFQMFPLFPLFPLLPLLPLFPLFPMFPMFPLLPMFPMFPSPPDWPAWWRRSPTSPLRSCIVSVRFGLAVAIATAPAGPPPADPRVRGRESGTRRSPAVRVRGVRDPPPAFLPCSVLFMEAREDAARAATDARAGATRAAEEGVRQEEPLEELQGHPPAEGADVLAVGGNPCG